MEICPLHDSKVICCPHCHQFICCFCKDPHIGNTLNEAISSYLQLSTSIQEDDKILANFLLAKSRHLISLGIQRLLSNNMFNDRIVHVIRDTTLIIFNPFTFSKRFLHLKQPINKESCSISRESNIYIIGGCLTDNVYKYNVNTFMLNKKESMITARYRHTLCTNGKFIFAIGGYNGKACLNQCERYSIQRNQWSPLAPLNHPRRECAAFTLNNTYIYCLGGFNRQRSNSIERLNLSKEEQWEMVSFSLPFTNRSSAFGIQVSLNKVLIIGGVGDNWEAFKDCYCLQINSDIPNDIKCNQLPSLQSASAFHTCSTPEIMHGRLYCMDYSKRLHVLYRNQWKMYV